MICVNLGFFLEKRLYVVNIFSLGYEMYSIIYKDIGKFFYFMCCFRV